MTARELEEYRQLRATILERGTARHWVVVAGMATWSVLAVAVAALLPLPAAVLLPLLVLATSFEVVFALHTAVERIGRYLQVFYEPDSSEASWENAAMAYGRTYGGGGIDPLFSPIYAAAALLNFIPVVMGGPPAMDWLIVAAAHLLFVARIVVARRQAAGQRAIDLDRFTRIRESRRT
jgi:hypothetical protein